MSARWRKTPDERGLASVGQGPRGFELREDGERLIDVNAVGGSWRGPLKGWYWCGLGVNTYNTKPLFPTAEAAKADADAYYKAAKKAIRSTK